MFIIFTFSNQTTSEDRSIINTFLAEIDGFTGNEHIFVLGATNDMNNLDSAALRPGRFDKIIHVPKPDKKGREEIFNIYLKKIKLKLDENVTSSDLSQLTPGFTGAEIENMVNLAIITAVDKEEKIVTKTTFEEARDRIILGLKYKYRKPKNLRYLLQRAVHEAGHTLICFKHKICRDNLHKVTIVPRGDSEGRTSYIVNEEDMQGTKEELTTFIDVAIGGILAEEIYFGEAKVSVGCGYDLNRATSLATSMVRKYGMSSLDSGYMVIQGGHFSHKISGSTRNVVDNASLNMVNKASVKVKDILNENISQLKTLTQSLLEYEELDKKDVENIIANKPLEDDKKRKVRSIDIATINI